MTQASGGTVTFIPTPTINPREITTVAFSIGADDTGTTFAPRIANVRGSPPCACAPGVPHHASTPASTTAHTRNGTLLQLISCSLSFRRTCLCEAPSDHYPQANEASGNLPERQVRAQKR